MIGSAVKTDAQKKTARQLKEWGLMTLGTLLLASGVYFFKFPNNFSTGGVSGLSVILGHYFPAITPGDFVMVINVALLLIGFAMLCVIALLALKLFTPGPEKAKKEKNVQTKKLREGEVRFKVEYGSESYVYTSNMKNYVRIGRATGDFPLNMADESVSRKHCEICCENGVMMLRDFSSYGTAVNGEICHHSQHVLHSGDVIEVGRHRIEIEFQSRNGGQRA